MASGAYILAPAGPILSPEEAAFFRDADPWGFILFARNVEEPAQLRRLTAALRESLGRDAPILIDQEGGRVQRMKAPHWREWMPPLDQVELFANLAEDYPDAALQCALNAARAMYFRGLLIGAELLAHGIDTNCAPSADLAFPETHPFLRNRCYGTDPETVASMARACADGLMDAGVLPVLKHAPGHGRATLDSHHDLPRIDVPLAELRETDFAPFRDLADLPMAMTAHIVIPELDDRPVTQSPAGVQLLRDDLGLKGLLMTDDISMNALSGDVAQRGRASLDAGCDLVLHCNGDMSEMVRVAELGLMTPEAAQRADIALSSRRTPTDIDISAAEAEFQSLIEGAGNGRRHRIR